MTTHYYSPESNPAPAEPTPKFPCDQPCCMGASPGGTDNRHMWDEKGGLDRIVITQAQTPGGDSLRAMNDSHRQGIYKTTSAGDYD